jgi:hypothetical protein
MIDLTFIRIVFNWAFGLAIYTEYNERTIAHELHLVLGVTHLCITF